MPIFTANANIGVVNLANTFDQWRVVTNVLVNDRNNLRNTDYFKDSGNFLVNNSILIYGSGAGLYVANNATVNDTLTTSNLTVNKNISTANLTVSMNTVSGNLAVTRNISTGNLTISMNAATGNLAVTSNIATGNLAVTSNIATGNLVISSNTSTSNLVVSTAANVVFANIPSLWSNTINISSNPTYNIVNGNAAFNNIVIYGTQTLAGGLSYGTDTIAFRTTQTTDGNLYIKTKRGSSGNNAAIMFNNTAGVWQASANIDQGYKTILTTANSIGVLFQTRGIVQPTPTGVDQPGQTTFIVGGPGTGAGTPGSIAFDTSYPTVSGSGVQSDGIRMTLDQYGTLTFDNQVTGHPAIFINTLAGIQLQSGAVHANRLEAYTDSTYYLEPATTSISLKCAGDIIAYYTSDATLKDNITTIPDALDKVLTLDGVTFNWNEKSNRDTSIKEAGVIAQQVQTVLPEAVTERSDGTLAVKYDQLIPLLIEAIKEQNDKIVRLQNIVDKISV